MNFTPGTITVNAAPTVPCDVKFIDGANVQTLKPNTNSIMTTLPAEPTKADHIFAGWYSGTVTGADATTHIVSGNNFTGKEFRPKYDMVTGAAEYHALWIPVANTAAFIRDNASNVATIYADATSLQSALTGAPVGKTVKLLKDWTVQITVPAGANLTLDMNGHSITPNFTAYVAFEMNGIKNNGTLSLENSSSAVALIAPTGSNILGRYVDGVFVAKTGVITSMRDITITATNYDITGEKNGKIDLIDHCALTTTAYAEACIFNVIVGELRNSTLTNTTNATITTGGMSVTLGEGNTFKPKAGSPAITVDKSNAVVFPTGKTMGAAEASGNCTLIPGFTVYYLNEAKTAVRGVSYCPTGTKATAATPTKPSNGMTSYTFAGWADNTGAIKTLAEIKENTELHPTFTSAMQGDVAQVGSVKYASIQDAADAIVATPSKTGTITVLKDFEFACTNTTGMLSVPAGATITLELGAKTITMKSASSTGAERPIINKGTLILQNGTITAAAGFPTADVVLNDENGVLTLDRLTITNFFYAIFNRGATIANITDTNIAGGQHAIYSAKASNAGVITDPKNDPQAGKILKITSGTFSVTASSDCGALDCMDTYIGEIAGGTFKGIGATQTYGARLTQSIVDKISGGTFETISPDKDGMCLGPDTTVGSITGGTFKGPTGLRLETYGYTQGTKSSTIGTISGGEFIGTVYNGLAVNGYVTFADAPNQPKGTLVPCGVTTISGGTFNGGENGIYMEIGGYINTISGGSFTGTTHGVKANEAAAGDPAAKGVTTITGGKFSGGTASVSPVGSSGACTVSGGSYKGDLVGVTYAPGKALKITPDAEGYHEVVSNTVVVNPPVVSGSGSATVTVPDKALDAQTSTINAKTNDETATETEVNLGVTTVGSMDAAEALEIDTDDAAVIFDKLALADIKTNATASGTVDAVKLKVADKKVTELLPAQQAAATGATKILDLKLTKADGKTDVTFAGGFAKIVVPYTQKDLNLTVNVYHIADNGTKTKRECKLVDGKLSFTTSSFSTYIIAEDLGQKAEYTMAVKTTDTHYNPGDTITANIVATAPVATAFGSCQFTLGFDAAALELQSLTSTLTPATINGGTLVFTSTDAAIPVGTGDTVIGTATFKVKAGTATGTSVITLQNQEMTYKGKDVNPTVATVVSQTVNLHNITVTFAADTNSTMLPATTTAYAKYNTAGLWTTEAYTTAFTFPVPTAKANYRLADKLWGDGTNVYTEAEAKALPLTANKALTVQTVKTATITFAAAAGGSIVAKDPVTVDAGAKISTVTLPVATANAGYSFTGWNDGANIIDIATYTVASTITLTAKFAPVSYAWIAPITTNTAFAVTSGVSAGNEVTHGTPIVFTATANTDYVITGVTYSVGAGTATALTASGNTYTIPGTAILGTIKVEIATQKYHSVTFKGTTGAALADQVAYVKDNTAGLYTDTTFKTTFTVPKLTADAGYRLAADTAAEPLWKDAATTGYTSVSIAEALLTADAVLTAQTVKIWTLSFTAGANGSLTYTDTALQSKTVDSGYVIKATDIPATVGTAGYVFDAWSATPLGAAVTADITYTASFKHGTYAISFSTTGATFTPTAGVATGRVTHGTDVTFTMTEADGYKVTAVKAQIGSAPAETLTAVSGTYTILGTAITGDVSITVESNLTYVVNFAAGTNGTLTGSASKTVDKDYVLQAADIPTPTANSGYVFKEWQVSNVPQAPLSHKVIAAITFTAVFTEGSYAVTMPDAAAATVVATSGLTSGNATYNTPVVFTVTGGAGKIVNKVYYTVAGGTKTELTTTDGTYTLPGNVITAAVTISVDTLDGTITFVDATAYKAMETGKQMLVFTTAKLPSNKYTLTDGGELYWSSKYGAYVRFVADTETVNTLSAKLTTAAGAATEILYDGNLNNFGEVTAADAGIINDILHSKRLDPTTDMHRFKADVDGSKVVTTADVALVTNTAAGVGK